MATNNIAFLIGLIAHFLSSELNLFNIRERDAQLHTRCEPRVEDTRHVETPGRMEDRSMERGGLSESGIRETFMTMAH